MMMWLKKMVVIILLANYSQYVFSQNVMDDTLQNKITTLNEVIMSVNKTGELKKYVAQQVQVLNSNEILKLQSQTTADLIANTGSVFIQKSQLGGGSITIRGFEANKVVMVIDGVRMNNIIYRAGHLQNIITTDNNALERVEILFGPSSTIYGSDALGGVVHLYTKNPRFATEGGRPNIKVNFFSRYGTVDNEITNHIDLNVGTKRFASFTALSYSKFDDLEGGKNQNPFYHTNYGERPYYVKRINGKDSLIKNDDRYLQVQSGYSQFDLMQKFSFQQNEHLVHGLNIQYSNSSDIPRYDRLTDPSGNTGLNYAEWYYGPQKRLLAAYDLNFKKPGSFIPQMHIGLNYQDITESRNTRKFNSTHLSHRNEHVKVMGANLDIQKNSVSHDIRFGVDMQLNTLKSTANSEDIVSGIKVPIDTRYPDGDNRMLNAALYFSHTWKINESLVLVDGLRGGIASLYATFVDTSFFHLPYSKTKQTNPVLSGNIGLISNPSDDIKLSLLFSTGFRVPNLDDLSKVFESAPGTLIVPNNDLKPEKTINTELGFSKLFGQKTLWETSVYYTQLQDAIVTDVYKYDGKDSILYDGTMSRVYANQNKGKAYIYGFSSAVKSQLSRNVLLSFNMNYTYGRIKTDSSDAPLDHIPPFMMRLALAYHQKNFSSDFFINYNGWKKISNYYLNGEDNEQYATKDGMPAWLTANFHVSYKIHPFITLQAGVDNIFDTQYRTFASGINAQGRNVFATVRLHY